MHTAGNLLDVNAGKGQVGWHQKSSVLKFTIEMVLQYYIFFLHLDLTSYLLKLNHHKLGWLKRSKANDDIDDAQVDIVLGGSLLIALDEVGVLWCLTLERTLAEQILHERSNIQTYLRPQRFIVRLEDDPLSTSEKTLFDVEGRPAHRNVLPL